MKLPLLVVGMALALRAGVAVAAPTVVLDDPLTAPGGSGQTVNDGTFSPAGWTRDSFDAQIVYDLGAPITAGRVVFEMDGVNGVDHGVGGFPDCRAIFAAVDNNGSGNIDDPGNESVQFLWAWAMEETDYCNGGPGGLERTDKMKLLVHTTGASEPGEPMSDPLAWDITQFYTYEIGWDEDHAWLHRDGSVVLDIAYPSAPIIMNERYLFLGTVNRYKSGVKNATYRNLIVYDDGGPTLPDAGVDSGVDAGGSCLGAGPLSPPNGSGTSASLVVPYSSCEGATAWRIVQIWVGDQVAAGQPAVSASLEAGLLHLDGSSDSCAPGDSKILSGTYGALDCAATTVVDAGDKRTVTWALSFDAAGFGGTHQVFADAKGGSGTPEPRLGWTALGTFNVVSGDGGADAGAAGSGAGWSGGPAGFRSRRSERRRSEPRLDRRRRLRVRLPASGRAARTGRAAVGARRARARSGTAPAPAPAKALAVGGAYRAGPEPPSTPQAQVAWRVRVARGWTLVPTCLAVGAVLVGVASGTTARVLGSEMQARAVTLAPTQLALVWVTWLLTAPPPRARGAPIRAWALRLAVLADAVATVLAAAGRDVPLLLAFSALAVEVAGLVYAGHAFRVAARSKKSRHALACATLVGVTHAARLVATGGAGRDVTDVALFVGFAWAFILLVQLRKTVAITTRSLWFYDGGMANAPWASLLLLRDGRAELVAAQGRLGYFASRDQALQWLGANGFVESDVAVARGLVDCVPPQNARLSAVPERAGAGPATLRR